MSLKIDNYKVFWYGDLQDFVKEIYGIDVRILDLEFEPRQDSYTIFDGLSEYGILSDVGDEEIVSTWISTGQMTDIDTGDPDYPGAVTTKHIIYRLIIEGHLEPAKYLMTIWW